MKWNRLGRASDFFSLTVIGYQMATSQSVSPLERFGLIDSKDLVTGVKYVPRVRRDVTRLTRCDALTFVWWCGLIWL